MEILSLANNTLTGPLPASLCNATNIQVIKLSFNNLSGIRPPCLLENTEFLQVLNLRGNQIDGVIPNQFSVNCSLKSLDLSNNKLGGKIPKSLANCKSLAVLNIGHNKLNDAFPCMLPSSLYLLVLSNRFHGDLRCEERWSSLQIVDISSNNFSGTLLPLNFSTWRGMMVEGDGHVRLNHSTSEYLSAYYHSYQDKVTLTLKGMEVELVKIWPDFTSLDLSCNNFHGDIPDAIGNLTSLYVLNLSHNALTNTIPKSLGALMDLGSLGLSSNQLIGRIPEELSHLMFLAFLNLSYNQLLGPIPVGPQLQTFSINSFRGNTELCDLPLNRSCGGTTDGNGSTKLKGEEVEWGYVCGAVGYVVGLGSIVWLLVFCGSFRERYFHKIEDIVYFRDGRRREARRRVIRNQGERRSGFTRETLVVCNLARV